MWKCRVDETENEDDVLNCPVCGAPKPAPVGTRWSCASCRTENDSDAVFCKTCGRKRAEPDPAGTKPARWVCDGCGTANDWDANFCKGCGRPKSGVARPAAPAPRPPVDTGHLRGELSKKETTAKWLKFAAIACIAGVLFLFALPYSKVSDLFTIFRNAQGINGSIEQICSMVVILFAVLPIPFLLLRLNIRRRNLPVTISLISAAAVTIYCLVIFFGSDEATGIPIFIILGQWLCAAASFVYVRTLARIDNMLFRPRIP